VRARTVAAGVAVAAVAGTVVPLALSPSASASKKPTTLAITKCTPNPAVIGHNVTIKGTDLAGATALKIGSKNVFADIISDTSKAIKVPVPKGLAVANPVAVTVTVNGVKATQNCTFAKPKKKKKHHHAG